MNLEGLIDSFLKYTLHWQEGLRFKCYSGNELFKSASPRTEANFVVLSEYVQQLTICRNENIISLKDNTQKFSCQEQNFSNISINFKFIQEKDKIFAILAPYLITTVQRYVNVEEVRRKTLKHIVNS